jgi:hypothetical protein
MNPIEIQDAIREFKVMMYEGRGASISCQQPVSKLPLSTIEASMDRYPNTERAHWGNITAEDASCEELHLIHQIMGQRPQFITPEQWRVNTRSIAMHIRRHVDSVIRDSSPDSSRARIRALSQALRDAISTYGPVPEILVSEERLETWESILATNGL